MKNSNEFTDIEKIFKITYDVANVREGFKYWYFKLLDVCLSIFEYENLPESLPAREIELNLLITGHAVIFKDKNGDLVTCLSSLSGFDKYYNPTYAIYDQPVLGGGTLYIDRDCSIIYNTNLKNSIFFKISDGSLNSFISRYARQLADLDATINIYAVNSRLTSYPVAGNDKVAQSLKGFFNKLKAGAYDIISDDTIIESFRNVDINRSNIKDGINDLLIARDKVLEQFFRDISVKFAVQKKAQVTEDEISSSDQMLLIQTDRMLKTREDGIKKVNAMFGSDISVKLNKNFDITNFKGGSENELVETGDKQI